MSLFRPRTLGTVNFTADGVETLELDREGVLAQVNLHLQFVITNGGTAAVGPRYQALARVINRVELVVNGHDTVVQMSGEDLATLAHYEQNIQAYGMGDTVVLTGSAATTYNVCLPIPLTLTGGRRPDDTGLDARNVGSLSLRITWGNTDDVYTTVNSAVFTSLTCNVEGEYYLEVPADRTFFVRSFDTIVSTVTATDAAHTVKIDPGSGVLYRSLGLITTRADLGVANILNNAKLVSGSFTYQDRKKFQILGANVRNYKTAKANLLTGAYMLPLIDPVLGELPQSIATGRLPTDLNLELDVTSTSGVEKIRVIREAIRPLLG